MERETGIEPASLAWKAKVLPLNYSRFGETGPPDRPFDRFRFEPAGTPSRDLPANLPLVEEAGFEPA